jgi:hypothetical protein
MKEFIILMATAMPESMLLNELKEAIEQHMLLDTEDTKRNVHTLAVMFVIKSSTSGEINKATDMINELDKIEKAKDLFTFKNNN